ncbi:GNAT family N-acetyltransferase [Novosphingobium sp. 1949]|uniref:GNAT family N-acetyltransferase n=1 Tax=Novosphingobium organovorum TaxID=2930092 RepID=A0ABT0BDM5_9SPHN|nr:GNAT family N-acetyltransferase [Novosphingobium organovorum]MCJ2183148.1 GNAT family N-acetyltransferase [Novosphingobium organovorum]
MFIRSARLFLRPGWPEDRDDLHRAIADRAVIDNLSRVPWPYTPDDAAQFLDLPVEHALPRFLITLPGRDGTQLVGCVGLTRAPGFAGGAPQLGYWITREAWGRGFASEAGRAVVDLARTLGHRRIVARHFIDNPASGRVLRKIGFRPTGRTLELFSAGRGGSHAALEYAVDLAGQGGGDGSTDLIPCRKAA